MLKDQLHVKNKACQLAWTEKLGASYTFVFVQIAIFVLSGPRRFVCAKSCHCTEGGENAYNPVQTRRGLLIACPVRSQMHVNWKLNF